MLHNRSSAFSKHLLRAADKEQERLQTENVGLASEIQQLKEETLDGIGRRSKVEDSGDNERRL